MNLLSPKESRRLLIITEVKRRLRSLANVDDKLSSTFVEEFQKFLLLANNSWSAQSTENAFIVLFWNLSTNTVCVGVILHCYERFFLNFYYCMYCSPWFDMWLFLSASENQRVMNIISYFKISGVMVILLFSIMSTITFVKKNFNYISSNLNDVSFEWSLETMADKIAWSSFYTFM